MVEEHSTRYCNRKRICFINVRRQGGPPRISNPSILHDRNTEIEAAKNNKRDWEHFVVEQEKWALDIEMLGHCGPSGKRLK